MNGIDRITASIEQETAAEIDRLRSETDAKCREIREKYELQAQEEYWTIVKQGMKDCESRVERLGSTAEMEAKKAVLAMKQTMVSQVFELAVKKVCSLPESEYVSFCAHQAAKAADSGFEELVFNERDKAGVGKKVAREANALLAERGLPGKLTVSEETRDIRGGLLVKQGDIEANCSVESLAAAYRSEMASQVAGTLF